MNWRQTFAWKSPPIYLMAVCCGLLLLMSPTLSQGQACTNPPAGFGNCAVFTSGVDFTLFPGGTVIGTLGNGASCNGDSDGLFVQQTLADGTVTCIDQNITPGAGGQMLNFAVDANATEVIALICRTSGGSPNICNITGVEPPLACMLEVTCPNIGDLGTYDCNNIATLPAPPTDEADAEAAPYNIIIGDDPCGNIVVLSEDNGTPDACTSGSFSRIITIFDDLGDDAGNPTPDGILNGDEVAETCTFTYMIQGDDVLPVFDAAPAAIADIACSDLLPTQETLTATDNCGTATVTPSIDPFTVNLCAGYAVTYRWTATDDCGNEAIETVTFNVLPDDENPTFVEALPTDVNLLCTDAIPDPATLTAIDNCDTDVPVGFAENINGSCPDETVITRTWTIEDDCRNTDMHVQTITIAADITPPLLSDMPANITLACDEAIPTDPMITATDDCTADIIVSLMETDDMAVCPADRIITRTWTATDECDNEVTYTQTITIEADVDMPTFVEALPNNLNLTCADAIPAAANLTAMDNCTSLITVEFEEADNTMTCPDTRTIVRTWTATDACDNVATHIQTIIIAPDDEDPVFELPLPDAVVNLTCADAVPAAPTVAATDNCTNPIAVILVEIDDMGVCPVARIITRTWTATDECDNEVEYIQTITIAPDADAPTFVEALPDAIVNLACADAIPPAVNLTAMDNCTSPLNVVFAEADDMGACPDPQVIIRTWTATDACMNVVTHTQTITIAPDMEMPVFVEALPMDLNLTCAEAIPVEATLTATDNCSTIVVVFDEVDNAATCPAVRGITRTWTATDDCGNEVQHVQNITIAPDIQAPVLSEMPANITLQCGDMTPAIPTITATDDCSTVEVIFEEIDMGDCPLDRVIERTWTATDDCDNVVSYTQTITIAPDTEAPVLSAMPVDIILGCGDPIPDPEVITATDNCTEPIEVIFEEVATGDCPVDRIIERTWTAEDACGNIATYTQMITVAPDTEDPVLSATPANITLACSDAIPDPEAITATDNCTTPIVVVFDEVDDMGLCPDPRIITRTWTATDVCGNEAIHTQTITVEPDTEDPAFVEALPMDLILTCAEEIPVATILTATDNCATIIDFVFNDDDNDLECPDDRTITRTWTATDECGNVAKHIQTITILPDTELPVLSAMPANIDLTCADAVPPAEMLTATDTCDDDVIVLVNEVSDGGTCPDPTIITRTYSATDDCGNIVEHVQTITIAPDTELPVLSVEPADVVLACGDAIPPAEMVTAIDNCTTPIGVIFNETDNNEVCPDARAITRIWTATDACGNEATYTQNITFEPDAEAPVLSEMPISIDLTCADAIPIVPTITATDNCTDVVNVVFNENDNNGVCPTARVITRTWTAMDACGNVTEHIQTITIAPDTEMPVLSAMPTDLDLGCNDAIPPAEVVTATDNCTNPIGVIFVENDDNGGICPADGGRTITRTWTATDACGNVGEHIQTIAILDDTPPTILGCPADEVDLICSYRVPLPDVSLVLADDECGTVAITHEGDVDTGPLSCPGSPRVITRTYRATDECGNFSDCIQTFTYLVDDLPPVAKVPENDTLTCGQILPTFAESLALLQYADANDCTLQADLIINVSDDFPVPTSFCEDDPRTVIRTFSITDLCGNETVRTQTFIFEADTTPPVITACPNAAPVILQCGDPLPPVDVSIIEATDNCTADDDITIIAQDDINPATTISCAGSPISVIRTYTVIDNCGNEATCQQTFTYAPDTEAPTITVCPSDVVDLQCGDAIPAIDTRLVLATDNCLPPESIFIEGSDDVDPATFTFCAADANGVNAAGDPAFIVTRTYTAMDKCGNESACTQQFIFDIDTEGPSFTCPAGISNLAPETPLPPVDTMAIIASAMDNCNGDVTVTHDNPALPTDYCPGNDLVVIRTITVTDACGNAATCEQTFTYTEEDNPPTIICPSNITICTDAGVCEAAVTWADPMPMDDCPGLQVIATHNSGDVFPIGSTAVSYTLIDAAGNVTGCKFIVTVEDCEDPIITCPASPVIVSTTPGQCDATVVVDPPASATDNCVNVSVTNDIPSGNVFPVGTTVVTYTATDDAGNMATCTIDVIVNDTETPTITGCPGDVLISNDAGECTAVVTWTEPVSADNCPGETIISSHASGDKFPVGTTTVTYTVTDTAGNETTCSFTVTVTDDENPVITCPAEGNITTNVDPGLCGAVVTWSAPSFTDNCPGGTITSDYNPGDFFPVGLTLVTYIIEDASGNFAICKFAVNVIDNEAPVITCPLDIKVANDPGECYAIVVWNEPVPTDNCPNTSIASTHNPGDPFPVGTTTVTYTVTDAAGNEATCSFDITVNDTEIPEVFCPGDILITTADNLCEATLTWTSPIITDNCLGASIFSVTHKPGSTFPVGVTTVTYIIEDATGNQGTCSFEVTVVDDIAPEMTCPTDIMVSADPGTCEATVSWTVPVPTDNCPGPLTLTSSHNPGDVFSVGSTTVTYSVEDASGRITQCSFVVTVNDDEEPPLTCPADITISTAPGTCEAIVSWTAPQPVTGDCLGLGITVTSSHNPGDVFPLGTTTVIYSAVDGAGNTALCSFNVIVEDNELPVVTCPSDILINTEPGMCSAVAEWTPPVPDPTDNCPNVVVVNGTHNSGDRFALGCTTVSYTIRDGSNNEVTCSFEVCVEDNETPTVACPTNITVNNDNGECGAVVTWNAPIPADNCPGATVITSSHNPGDFFPVGMTKVVYTVEDATGDVAQCSFMVEVIDNNPVLLVCPADMVANTDGGRCDARVFWDAPIYIDNCDESNLSSSHEPGDVFPLGCTTVEYFVTQTINGQLQIIETCEFEVCVEDNEAPTFDCPANIQIVTDPGECTAFVDWIIPTPSDNCPGAVISGFTHSPGQEFSLGTTVVVYTIDDANGNSDLCIFSVTVEDGSILGIECPADINTATTNCEISVSWAVPAPTGNCAGALTTTSTHNPGDIFPIGCTTVTYTITDVGNNTVSCDFDVCIEDASGPTLVCPVDITTSANTAVCGRNITIPVPEFGTDYDDCTGATIINSMNATNDASGFYPVGLTTVVWTVTDDDGNVVTCEQTIEVIDNTILIVECPDDITVSTSPGNCSAIVAWNEPDASDNCTEIVSINSTHNSGDAFPVGCTTVTYTVIGSGNAAVCSFDVCVEECAAGFNDITQSIAPLISDQDVFVGGTDMQSFASNGVYTFTDPSTPASATLSNILLELFFRVENASCESDIEIQLTDPSGAIVYTGAPFTTCNGSGTHPAGDLYNITVPIPSASAIGSPANWILGFRDTNDQNTGAVEYSVRFGRLNYDYTISVPVPGGCADPVIVNCPADINTSAGTFCGANLTIPAPIFGIDYTDCTNATITNDYTGTSSGTGFYPVGTTTVTWTVTDAAGNTVSCQQTITIVDDIAPVITCPPNISVTTSAGNCDGMVTWPALRATDNCAISNVTATHSPGVFPTGTTTVTYTATDNSGNVGTCSFDVTVEDLSQLSIICPSDVSVVTQPGQCTVPVSWSDPTIAASCVSASFTSNSHNSGDQFPIGCTTVTYVATDNLGNTTNCNFEVCVDECSNGGGGTTSTTETVTLIDDSDINVGFNDAQSFATNTTYTFNDPATPANAVISNATLQLFFRVEYASCESEIEVRLTDPAGNVVYTGAPFTTCNGSGANPYPGQLYNVTIPIPGGTAMTTGTLANWVVEFRDTNDQNAGVNEYTVRFGRLIYDATITTQTGGAGCGIPLIVNCPADITQSSSGSCGANLTIPAPVFGVDFLDCGNATMTNSFTGTSDASGTYPAGTTVVVWTVTDNDGNTATCEQMITITDDVAPSVNCPADITVSTLPGQCDATVTWAEPTITDNCSVVTTSRSHNSGDTFPIGCTTVSYTATDDAGNTAACDFLVCVDECNGGSSSTTETITLISDDDLFVGAADAQSFASNDTYTFTDPATPAGAVISNGTLQLFFRVENASCESDIEIQLTDPAGNVVYTGNLFNTCNGSGANPYPGQLYNVTIPISGGATTGNVADWVLEFRDTNDQNAGAVEYSVRFGRLIYDATTTTQGGVGCGLPALVNCPADITVQATNADCNVNVSVPIPVFGIDFLDCSGAVMTNDYTGTSNASAVYPSGTTVLTWTVTDSDGNTATCEQIITVTENGCGGTPEFTSCPNDLTLTTTPGNCGAVATWTPPIASTGTVTSTHNPGEEFPVGCTTVTYTIVGTSATCSFDVCVEECIGSGGETTTETVTLIDDGDLFVGFNDMESFASNTFYTFNDPGTPANAVLSNITLQLFFRVEYASCESDIEIRVNDPAGNVVYTGTLFTTCNGSGANPYPGQLYNVTIPIPNGTTTGNIDDWTVEFRDTNDQNAGVNEYSVRFGRLIYDATVTTSGQSGCGNPEIVNCPADITVSSTDGTCEAAVSVPVPVFGTDFTDCTSATMTNDYTGTADASATYPAGTTIVTWTVTDAQGNTATCQQSITVNAVSGQTTSTVTLIDDSDLLVGAADAQSFASNATYSFTDPSTPANAILSNITLQLFFRVENASCESDIEIRLTDPTGAVVYVGAPFATCNGSGANPYPGQLYNITIPIPSGSTTGSAANWTVEFRDTNDQNTGAVEYTARFGRLIYDATVGTDCTVAAIVNDDNTADTSEEGGRLNPSTQALDIKLYPVPTMGRLTLEYMATQDEQIQIQVINTQGQTLHTREATVTEGVNTIDMKVYDLPGGMYFVRTIDEQGMTKVKPFTKLAPQMNTERQLIAIDTKVKKPEVVWLPVFFVGSVCFENFEKIDIFASVL